MAGTTIHEGLRSRINQLLQDVRYELLGLRYGFIRVEVEDLLGLDDSVVFRAKHLCGVWGQVALPPWVVGDSRISPAQVIASKMIRMVTTHSDYQAWLEQREHASGLSVAELRLLRDVLNERRSEYIWTSTPVSDRQWVIDEPGQDQAPLEHNRVDDVTWLHRWLHRGRPEEALADKAVADALAVDPLEELE